MNLDAALDAALDIKIRKGPVCTMGAALSSLPPQTRDKLLTVLTVKKPDGQLVSSSVISHLLIANGYDVKPQAVIRHRRRLFGEANGCACDVG